MQKKDSLAFDLFYAKLNPRQREAVDAVEGPVMVVAGPGTGKTQILTLRIANILKATDTAPESILALTFTDSAVYSMRRRLSEVIGSSAYRVNIFTFHGFANGIIKQFPEEFPRIIGSTNITEVEQIEIVKKIIESASFKRLAPYGDKFYYVRPILQTVNELKREGVEFQELEKRIKETEKDFFAAPDLFSKKGVRDGKLKIKYEAIAKQIEKSKELLLAYRKYEKTLVKKKLYDYNDMIIEVVRALKKNPEFLLALQEQYQYFLADEHQDANNAQNQVLEFLASFHPSPNIFIVGDAKQAIFRFQGASLNNFFRFRELYPTAKIIYLEENYRSTQTILDAAKSLADKNILSNAEASVKLKAAKAQKEKPIRLLDFESSKAERLFLAKDIAKIIAEIQTEEGEDSFPDIAVIYRDNADAFPIHATLARFGIPSVIQSDENILGSPIVKKIIAILKAVGNYGEDESFAEGALSDFFEIEPSDFALVAEKAFLEKKSVWKVAHEPEILKALNLKNEKTLTNYTKLLARWKKYSAFHSLPEIFESIIRESNCLKSVMSEGEVVPSLEKINGFFKELQAVSERHKNYGLTDFLKYLETLKEHNVSVKGKQAQKGIKGIRLLTAHKSKGMEFDYVYIVKCFDGHWGNKRRNLPLKIPAVNMAISQTEELNDSDERRLFYVALTRAKKEVTITYASEDDTGEEKLPSRFIGEIRPELMEKPDSSGFNKEARENPLFDFLAKTSKDPRVKDISYIKEIFSRRGLSVTGLNNYLECPFKYFFVNLLRLPQAKAKHQLYGTAIHEALSGFFSRLSSAGGTDKAILISLFEDSLNKQPLREDDYGATLQRGLSALSGYYDEYNGKWRTKIITEFGIKGVEFSHSVKLTGKLDKIEILSDSLEVNVVDYKTGLPKSRNDIEGKTKNSAGNIKRQIIFYKILLDAYADHKYKMISGEVDFVEPNERGNYKKELFKITEDEILAVKGEIERVAAEILSLAFWNIRCKDPKCRYCSLREMME